MDQVWLRLKMQDLNSKNLNLENDQKEYANLKKLKMFSIFFFFFKIHKCFRKMTEEENDHIRYIKDNCGLQEQANNFFQMTLIKNVEIKDLKKEIENVTYINLGIKKICFY